MEPTGVTAPSSSIQLSIEASITEGSSHDGKDQSSVAGSLWPPTLSPSPNDNVEREMDVKRLLAFQANAISTISSEVPARGHSAEDATTATLDSGINPTTTNLRSSNPQSSNLQPSRDYRHNDRARCLEGEMSLPSLPYLSNASIPSPLASPITATAASLTALSISQSSCSSQVLYARDLRRVTVPRDTPSSENLLVQDHCRDKYRESAPQEQSGMFSDPETSTRTASRHVSSHKLTTKEGRFKVTSQAASSATIGLAVNNTVKLAHQLRVTLHNLVSTGYLPAETRVIFRDHSAIVTAKGTLIPIYSELNCATHCPWLQGEYETPSAWATAVVKGARTGKVAVNGWSAIKVNVHQNPALVKMFSGQGLPEVSLDVLRKRYLMDMVDDGLAQTEIGSAMMDAGEGGTFVDRKKRKRPSAKAAEGLRISTGGSGTPVANTPRKRTVSDVSGTITVRVSDALSLDLEAAGVLFAMQDDALMPSSHGRISRTISSEQKAGGYGSRRLDSVTRLQSLMTYHAEQKCRMRRLSGSLFPTLRTVGVMKLYARDNFEQDFSQQRQCHGCRFEIDSGSTIVPTNESVKPKIEPTVALSQNTTKVCAECKDVYHLRCLPRGHMSEFAAASWKCPRCNTCSLCHISVFRPPAATAGTDDDTAPKDHDIKDTMAISVLCCNQCQTASHLQCQIDQDSSIKKLFLVSSTAPHDTPDWICFECRKCVECGAHAMMSGPNTASSSVPNDDILMESFSTLDEPLPKTEIGWSQGFALCPECTQLAEKGNVCPLCCCIYRDDDYETPMIFCDGCFHWVHVACDRGLEEGDYEELGQDSKQYYCPSCITPTPSPTRSSLALSVDRSSWEVPYNHDCNKEPSCSGNEEDQWIQHLNHHRRSYKRRDDILDLINAAKEISDSESRARHDCGSPFAPSTPHSSCSPAFSAPGTHSRTVSASLESAAEVVAAEALLAIFSGANTPIQSYPPSPFEGSMFHDELTSLFPPTSPSALRERHYDQRHDYFT